MSRNDRVILKLSYDQHRDLCTECYYSDLGIEHEFTEVSKEHTGDSRHTSHWIKVFKRTSDGSYFEVRYQDSVKDEMGWKECNEGHDYDAREVFPKLITTTIFE